MGFSFFPPAGVMQCLLMPRECLPLSIYKSITACFLLDLLVRALHFLLRKADSVLLKNYIYYSDKLKKKTAECIN